MKPLNFCGFILLLKKSAITSSIFYFSLSTFYLLPPTFYLHSPNTNKKNRPKPSFESVFFVIGNWYISYWDLNWFNVDCHVSFNSTCPSPRRARNDNASISQPLNLPTSRSAGYIPFKFLPTVLRSILSYLCISISLLTLPIISWTTPTIMMTPEPVTTTGSDPSDCTNVWINGI